MDAGNGDDILAKAAQDGSMDYSAWPQLLPVILARIEQTAHTAFPIPKLPSPPVAARPPPSPRFLGPLPSSDPFEAPDQGEPSSSQGTDKENADPPSPAAARTAAGPPPAPALPKPVADMLDEILSVLRTNFPRYPPHTIQRLSELVLRPTQHYRNLVPYLHALDRVVHVTSGANTYPLPPALPDIGAMSLLAANAAASGGLSIDTTAANQLGSDEALGGALLTPIPWLAKRANGAGSDNGSDAGSSSPLSASGSAAQQFQLQQQQQRQGGHLEGRVRTESTETIEGPNGMGSIETVSVSVNGIPSTGAGVSLLTQRSVTQGELPQEQRAGLVPLNQHNRQQHQRAQGSTSDAAEDDAPMTEAVDSGEEDDEEIPHARGPEEIGPADTGPQGAVAASFIAGDAAPMDVQGIDIEAAVGRRVQSPPQSQIPLDHGKRASGSPESLVPQSPKREASDDLELASPRKRVREDETAAAIVGAAGETKPTPNQPQQPSEAEPEAAAGAEGDVVLSDAATVAESEGKEARSMVVDAGSGSHSGSASGETAVEGREAPEPEAETGGDAAGNENEGG
ncbi:hypothetical protein C8A05DRAFT_41255 [Staphylotrichum tortipilum]|uniref:Protein phosphatase 4 core regulatory subunit R2 n=1 Tax=Staphylotrichum tortipilum TaxID=2831512 RepID=A0AAN6RWT3_9PEZI|nr:hypothetical protein C8A05DRAFT_41255 [Staphylotrichum longicolle]